MQLLVIEDEAGASDALVARLTNSGFRATSVMTCAEAAAKGGSRHFFAALIDHTDPATSPAALVQPLREGGISQPIIVLSPRSHWRDKVDTLDAGADDYAIKPIHSDEVAARLRAVIRRSSGLASDRVVFGGLDLDLKARCAWLHGRCLNLSRSEFRMLRLLVLANYQPVSREEVVAALSNDGSGSSRNAVEVLVSRLRQKLGGELIRTVRGVGYSLDRSLANQPKTVAARSTCVRDAQSGDAFDFVI
ncbi:MAG: response regulator transcription factor [Novosphingobium sp.]|uniref:winged helix-turn-helix domain-containing protein n=1 Tax=Novosphingobium sp. TaxID=1874826 RepID=UPI003C79B772